MMQAAHTSDHDIVRAKRHSFGHELARDWRRWSKGERVAAGFVLAGLMTGIAALVETLLRQSF